MAKLDETTSIPLFAVITAVPFAIGFIIWLSTIYSVASNAQQTNKMQDVKIEQTRELLLDIRDRIIRIEEHLNK